MMIGKKWATCLVSATLLSVAVVWLGCGSNEGSPAKMAKPVIVPSPSENVQPMPTLPAPSADLTRESPVDGSKKAIARGVVVDVDGTQLTKAQLDSEIRQRMAMVKDRIPTEGMERAKPEIRKRLIDEFVVRTVLSREIARRKITANEKEIGAFMKEMGAQLPAGTTVEEVLKRNKVTAAKMREEIVLNIRINKLVVQDLGRKADITDKEIVDFYNGNLDKFQQSESVHARHILVAKSASDSEKTNQEKRSKAGDLRKQLVAGADFAELASKNSDCPSKQDGGDLGTFSRGQMVKPFEDAAFSQEKDVIGPVVETDYGFHIIQVLDHQDAQVRKLDGETRELIGVFLKRKRQEEAFNDLVKSLRAKANIVIYGS